MSIISKTFVTGVIAAAAAMSAQASIVYQTGANQPWGNLTNDAAMDTAFGAGNWSKSNGFSLGAITASSFAFLDGSDSNAVEFNNFLSSNISALEAYVAGGGHLFLNAAPNEGGSINFGFGVTLNYPGFSSNVTVNAAGVMAGLTAGGIPTTYTGSAFAHSSVSGGSITSLIDGEGGSVFAVKTYGNGFVAFGGQTTTNFHYPNTEAQQLLVNELKYVANANVAAVPEPESYALALAGLGIVGAALRRRKSEGVAA